jgi:hypothetical protein
MHCIKYSPLIRKNFIKIGCLVLLVAMTSVIGPAWSGDRDKTIEKPIFKPLYYDQATGLGIIQDIKGTALNIKNALFRIHVKENGAHKIFCIEAYPEELPIRGTHIDELPVDIINMLLKTYPRYNLM